MKSVLCYTSSIRKNFNGSIWPFKITYFLTSLWTLNINETRIIVARTRMKWRPVQCHKVIKLGVIPIESQMNNLKIRNGLGVVWMSVKCYKARLISMTSNQINLIFMKTVGLGLVIYIQYHISRHINFGPTAILCFRLFFYYLWIHKHRTNTGKIMGKCNSQVTQ